MVAPPSHLHAPSPLHTAPVEAAFPLSGPDDLLAAAALAADDAPAAVALAVAWGARLPLPGGDGTAARFDTLRAVARADLTAARVLEAHTDALAIIAEAGAIAEVGRTVPADSSWGVFAAEGPGAVLVARPEGVGHRLDGVKPWCSLGGLLDRALVTAHVADGRQLFAVDLRHPGVRAAPAERWAARGLQAVTSGPVEFTDVPATPVGPPGWYLQRPGFAWGGIGVAACWLGGVDGLVGTLLRTSRGRDGDLAALHVGIVDLARYAADRVLADAARQIAAGQAAGDDGMLLAARVRGVVADTVERVLQQVGHALGPAPLAFDAAHARRVADLTLYVRQHHAERDLAALGRDVQGRDVLSRDGSDQDVRGGGPA